MKPARNTIAIVIGFSSAVAIIAGIAILTYRNILNVLDSFEEVRRTNQVIENLEEIVSAVKDAEIGQRDYIITGDEQRLGLYYASLSSINQLMATLRSLTSGNLKQQRRIVILDPLIARKLARMKQRIELRKTRGFDAALQDIRSEQEEGLMDQIHIVVGEMENEEVHLLAAHEARLRLREKVTFTIFGIGTFVSLGIVLAIFLLLNQEITWRSIAERALKRAHDDLELRVQERTAQLASTNQAMRDSEERFRQLAEGTDQVFWFSELNPERVLYVSPAFETIWGATAAELYQDPRVWLNSIHPDDQPRVRELFDSWISGRTADYDVEYRIINRLGETRWIRDRGTAIRDATGRIYRVSGIADDVTEIRLVQEGLRKLSGHLLELQDQERRQIARNLHDVTAQNLSAVTLNLARLGELCPTADERQRNILAETLTLTEQCLREIRTLSYVLHPPLLDETGLESALRWYVKGFTGRSGIPVDLVLPPEQERLPAEIETTLFRVIQEGLTNIHRHSGCKRARIDLARLPHEVRLEIKDDGKGFPKETMKRASENPAILGVGLMGMRERLRQLNGSMEIESNARGTTVKAVLPLGRNGL